MAMIEKAICNEYAYFDILGLGVYPQENQAAIKYVPIIENQVNTTVDNSLSEKENFERDMKIFEELKKLRLEKENLERDLQRFEPATGHQGLTKENKSTELETGHQGLTKEFRDKSAELEKNKTNQPTNVEEKPKKWYYNPFVILAACAATVLTAGYLLRPTQETEKENTKKEEVSGLPKKLK